MLRTLVAVVALLVLAACGAVAAPRPTPVALPAAPTSPRQAATPTQTASAPARPLTPIRTPQPSPGMALTATPNTAPTPAAPIRPRFSYPIGTPGQPPGDGFVIRHGFQTENTWYNPGYWHTGEDWYAQAGDTAGAQVYAIADGVVVYAGANYPGRVVIIRHADDLFSMYGHLDPRLNVTAGQPVARGALLGTVLRRSDQTPNHLHFEVRSFLTTPAVNGPRPRYGFRCGARCPPGPGYWPIRAPDLPSDLGWRNPTHVIARRMFAPTAGGQLGEAVVATRPISPAVALWSAAPSDPARHVLDTVALHPGRRVALLDVWAGPEESHATSALGYQLWYRIQLSERQTGWVQAAVATSLETGADGRSSSVAFNFWPAIEIARKE